ncbi:hypothetical protein ARSEF1564_009299 [Beauveria bassiana]
MDVFGPPNVSLDYRLRYSPKLVDILHHLLNVILTTLKDLTPSDESATAPTTSTTKKRRISESEAKTPTTKTRRISVPGRPDVVQTLYNSSKTDSEGDEGERNITLITDDIGATVTQLCRISDPVRRSAKIARAKKMAEYEADEKTNIAIQELRLYTECYIRFRFPRATEALCSALVEANALRLRRLCYQREHRKRVALSIQSPLAALESQLPKVSSRVPAVHSDFKKSPKLEASHGKSTPPLGPQSPTTLPTTAQQAAVRALYEICMTKGPWANSVAADSQLSLPTAPESEPFVCVIGNCTDSGPLKPGSSTFDTSRAWLSHMKNAHRYVWVCRAPSHEPIVFEDEAKYQEHIRTNPAVCEEHVVTMSVAAKKLRDEKITTCPFGDDFAASEDIDSDTVFSSKALQLHVATHLKEISLLALQKLPCDNDNNSREMASDLL